MEVSLERANERESRMVCPTCGAEQSWAAECRRCKSDLDDLFAIWRDIERTRVACLIALRQGRHDRALRHARRYVSLDPGLAAVRLLAVCNLLAGNWLDALIACPRGSGR